MSSLSRLLALLPWPRQRLRISIVDKILLGMAVILVVGTCTMLVIYDGLTRSKKALHEVANVEEPTSAAAYEMEINVIGTGMGVLKYLDTSDPKHRDRVKKDQADFKRFKAQYDKLTGTPRSKDLSLQIDVLYQQFSQLGQRLMDSKDDQDRMLATLASNFEALEQIIDQRLLPLYAGESRRRERRVAYMAADIARVGRRLGAYLNTHKEVYRRQMLDSARSFRSRLDDFDRFSRSPEEQLCLEDLEKRFAQTMSLIQKLVAIDGALQTGVQNFIDLRRSMDDLLDDQIQVLAKSDLAYSKREADRAWNQVIHAMIVLIPTFGLVVIGAGMFLAYSITRPLRRLVKGYGSRGFGGPELSSRSHRARRIYRSGEKIQLDDRSTGGDDGLQGATGGERG